MEMHALTTTKKVYKVEKDLVVIEAVKKEVIRGLGIFLLLAVTFLFLRIVFALLGSNPNSLFAGFVYLVSGIFLLPFWGIFPQLRTNPVAQEIIFDSAAFIALFSYLLVIPLTMAIVAIVASMFKTNKQVHETVEKDTLIDPSDVDTAVK